VIEDVLIKVGEFIFPVDFITLDTNTVLNTESHISVILGCPFSATLNALINYRNDMMKLALVGEFSYDELEFENVDEFSNKHESFLMDN